VGSSCEHLTRIGRWQRRAFLLLRSATPFFTATISATMDTAISAGVRLPRSSPIGPCSRAISAGDRSNSASRSLRLAVLPREPSAPT
jgi:hypothetical protein